MRAPLDYMCRPWLYFNEEIVYALTITGTLVEEFFRVAKKARVSTAAVSGVNHPGYVWITLDGFASELGVSAQRVRESILIRIDRARDELCEGLG